MRELPKRAYKVWLAEDGDTEDDASVVETYSPEAAAQEIIARDFHGDSDTYEVMVSDDEAIYHVTVDVECEPSYMSHLNKIEKRKP